MIFKRELAEKILNGEKTQTRRIVVQPTTPERYRYNGDWLHDHYGTEPPSVFSAKPGQKAYRRWQVGRTYAICPGRTKPGIGHIRITSIRKQRLQDITDEDALAEGCQPGEWMETPGGTRLRFNSRAAFHGLWDSINKKPGIRWSDNPEVWVITFELVEQAEKAIARSDAV